MYNFQISNYNDINFIINDNVKEITFHWENNNTSTYINPNLLDLKYNIYIYIPAKYEKIILIWNKTNYNIDIVNPVKFKKILCITYIIKIKIKNNETNNLNEENFIIPYNYIKIEYNSNFNNQLLEETNLDLEDISNYISNDNKSNKSNKSDKSIKSIKSDKSYKSNKSIISKINISTYLEIASKKIKKINTTSLKETKSLVNLEEIKTVPILLNKLKINEKINDILVNNFNNKIIPELLKNHTIIINNELIDSLLEVLKIKLKNITDNNIKNIIQDNINKINEIITTDYDIDHIYNIFNSHLAKQVSIFINQKSKIYLFVNVFKDDNFIFLKMKQKQ